MADYYSVFSASVLSQHQDTWHLLSGGGKKHSASTLEPTHQLRHIQLLSCSQALVSPLHIAPHLLLCDNKGRSLSQDQDPKTKKSWTLTQPCSQGESHTGTHLMAKEEGPNLSDLLLWHHHSQKSSLSLSQVNKTWRTREWSDVKLPYVFQAPFGI